MKTLKRTFLTASAFIVLLGAAGCGRVTVDNIHIQQAIKLCSENEGLKEINQLRWLLPNYICENGTVFEIERSTILKKTPTSKGT